MIALVQVGLDDWVEGMGSEIIWLCRMSRALPLAIPSGHGGNGYQCHCESPTFLFRFTLEGVDR